LLRGPDEPRGTLVLADDIWYGAHHSDGTMQASFNHRWRRHDGFGLLAVAILVAAAIVAGFLTAGR